MVRLPKAVRGRGAPREPRNNKGPQLCSPSGPDDARSVLVAKAREGRGAPRGPRDITDAHMAESFEKSCDIARDNWRRKLAYALLYREALRSLKKRREGDVIRGRLAELGFTVRDAEQRAPPDSG